jgi:MutS domain V
MKAHLLYPDADLDARRMPPPLADELVTDLELGLLLDAMAAGDAFLRGTAETVLLAALTDPDTIAYRQAVLADCLRAPDAVRTLYALAVEALDRERRLFGGFLHSPGTVLQRAVMSLELFVDVLRRLRATTRQHADGFRSPGLTAFSRMLEDELGDDYFRLVGDHLDRLRFRGGVLVSARLGPGNRGEGYVLRSPHEERGWLSRLGLDRTGLTMRISDRDEAGARAVSELRDQGVSLVARALGNSAQHILDFFRQLRAETGFYVACLNVHEALSRTGRPVCFPTPTCAAGVLTGGGVYDPCLALATGGPVVGNDVESGGRRLVVVTGANQGGKSTFLRSVGLAQLMMQAGMFVPATSFQSSVCDGVFTHFKREEDTAMVSGKLDEELRRMSDVVDRLTSRSMLLCNESFATTNEREGSEIARQVVQAMLESGVRVVFVTHLYDLAQGWYRQDGDQALFLRAERQEDGTRTYVLAEGEPLPTSFGPDLYERVFGG